MYSKITYRFENIRLCHDRVYVGMHDLAEVIPNFYFLPGEGFTFDNGITVGLKISKFPGVNIPNKGDEDDHAYLSILYCDYLQCRNDHDATTLAYFLTERLSEHKRRSIVGENLAPIILNPKLIQTMERIDTFFNSEKEYKKYGIKHTRGVLLYGPPGTGKTSFICEVVKKYPDAVVFDSLSSGSFIYDEPCITQKKFIGKQTTRFIVYLDEMEGVLKGDDDARRAKVLKQIETLPNNTLLIATTNRPESIDIAFFNRPGRFEEAIYLGYPDWPEIETFMWSRGCSDLALPELHGLNFAHLNELIYRVKINHEDPKMAYWDIKRLDAVKKLDTEQDPGRKIKIGFGEL